MRKIQSELQNLINEYLKKEISNEHVLANRLNVSIPTLQRWREGKNLPATAIAQTLVSYLKSTLDRHRTREIRERLKEYHAHKNDPHVYFTEEIEQVRNMKSHAVEDIEFLLSQLEEN